VLESIQKYNDSKNILKGCLVNRKVKRKVKECDVGLWIGAAEERW